MTNGKHPHFPIKPGQQIGMALIIYIRFLNFWSAPRIAILGPDQKERGLWGKNAPEVSYSRSPRHSAHTQYKIKSDECDWLRIILVLRATRLKIGPFQCTGCTGRDYWS